MGAVRSVPKGHLGEHGGSGMQSVWSWLAVNLAKRAGLVSLVGLVLTLVLGFGVTRLQFATGQDSYLNKGEDVYVENVDYQRLFGGDAMLTVIQMDRGHTVDELFDSQGASAFTSLHDELTTTGRYTAIVTPLVALEFSDQLIQGGTPGADPTASVAGTATLRALSKEQPGSAAATARQADAAKTLERITAVPAAERTLSNPDWVKVLLYDNNGDVRLALRSFFPDDTHAQIIVRLQGNLSLADEGVDAVAVQERAGRLSFDHATTVTSGAPILLNDINDYLRGGMLTLGGIAVAVMVAILLLLFNVRWRLLPIAVVLLGVLWAFGVAGYVGIPLTIVTIAGLPVMLGIGIDYAIQMQARIEEESGRPENDGHPIQAAAVGLGPALLVVTLDAVFAFLALLFAKVPMIRHFGTLLAVGVVVICVVSIVAPLAVLGAREHRRPTKVEPPQDGALGKLTIRLGSLPTGFAIPLAVASIVIFAAGLAVEGRLTIQTDPIQWVNQSSQTVTDIHTIERQVGGANELGVFVQSDDVFSDDVIAFVHDFSNGQLDRYGPGGSAGKGLLLGGSSIEQAMSDLLVVPGTTDIRASTVAADRTALNIIFRTGSESLDAQAPIVNEIRADTTPPSGTRATPSGLAVVGVGLVDNLKSNRILLTYLAMGFVFAFLCVRLRSLTRAALSLVPVGIAVGVASLVPWALGMQLSPMTAVGGPLVIAACTEFTSLILLRFVEERQRGLDPHEAMRVTAGRTGRAFIVSGLTAIAGVAVLSLSSLPLLRDFGRIVALNVTVALLSALVVLPPILVAAERRGWVTHGLLHDPANPPAAEDQLAT